MTRRVVLAAVMVGWVIGMGVFSPAAPGAADHSNLEEGLPLEVEDAYATAYRNREIQGVIRWDRTDEGKDKLVLTPRFEWGFLRNAQLRVDAPFILGDADKTGSGDVRTELFYNFNTESVYLPAFAASVRADFPSGHDSRGIDTSVKLIASKMPFPWTTLLHRIHVNVAWTHNSDRREGERSDFYTAVVGFSVRAWKDTLFLADYVREAERERGKDANILEAGIRQQITPLLVLSLGAGAGIGEDSPDFRLRGGFQYSF